MKRANGDAGEATFLKYALLALVGLSVGIVSCENGIVPQNKPERIRFCKEHFEGWFWQYAGGTYIDNNGKIYIITAQMVQSSLCSNGYSDSIASLILSKGTMISPSVPSDTFAIMDSLLTEVHKNSDSTSHLLIDAMGGCQWCVFDLAPGNGQDAPIKLKQTGSYEYNLVSEQAIKLTKLIERYCGNSTNDCAEVPDL